MAKQQNSEREEKAGFIKAASKAVLISIDKHLFNQAKKVSVNMTVYGQNRYFTLHRYCEDLKICIYRSGDIDFHFKEFSHNDVNVRVIHYETVPQDPEAALIQFSSDLDFVISCFMSEYCNGFMDYQASTSSDLDWRSRALLFLDECKNV